MDQNFDYPAFVTSDEAGKFRARFPDFPEARADGYTKDEALRRATCSLTEALTAKIEAGEPIPMPTEFLGDVELVKPKPHIIAIAQRHCSEALS